MNVTGLLQGIGGVLLMLAIGLVVLAVGRASQARPLKGAGRITAVLVGLALVIFFVSLGLVFIEPDEIGVIISPYDPNGIRSTPLSSGLHWIIPGERVQRYTIRRQTYTMSVAPSEGQIVGDDSIRARTKDGQEVYIDSSVIYQIDPAQVVSLHKQWQNRYEDNLIRPLARGVIRDAISQFNVEEIVSTKRSDVETYMSETMGRNLKDNSLMLVQFILRDIHFSDEYASAVEQKQIAQQQALQAENMVKQKEFEAKQAVAVAKGMADSAIEAARGEAESWKINAQAQADARLIQAQAEATALNMIAAALQGNPDLLTYQYITKLAPNVQVMYLPTGQQVLIPLPTADSTGITP
jgi:regulator of protease activity HflC (stomatin/prohibitin superfamily)